MEFRDYKINHQQGKKLGYYSNQGLRLSNYQIFFRYSEKILRENLVLPFVYR